MKENQKIVLRGHVYATPNTESVEIKSQGVLCASGVANGNFNLGVNRGSNLS